MTTPEERDSETVAERRSRTEGRSGFKITIPLLGGAKIEATGKDVFIVAIIVGLALSLSWSWDHKDATAKEHGTLTQAVGELKDQVSEHTYVLTLPQERREALNLQMPETLRRKVRANNGN